MSDVDVVAASCSHTCRGFESRIVVTRVCDNSFLKEREHHKGGDEASTGLIYVWSHIDLETYNQSEQSLKDHWV